MTDPIIAQLLDENCQLVDCVSFRDRSQLAAWLGRTPIHAGDRIVFKEGGRRIPLERIGVNGDGERTIIPFHPRETDIG